jgi:hypothetical protein
MLLLLHCGVRIVMSGYENRESPTKNGEKRQSDGLRSFVADIERSPDILEDPKTGTRIMRELGQLICTYKRQEREMSDEEASGVVIDSLISIKVINWFRRNLSLEITLTEISRVGNVSALSKLTIAAMKAKHLQKNLVTEIATTS